MKQKVKMHWRTIGKSIDKLAKEQEDKKKPVDHADKTSEANLTRIKTLQQEMSDASTIEIRTRRE